MINGVKSEGRPGRGCTFYFTLPAAPHPQPKSPFPSPYRFGKN